MQRTTKYVLCILSLVIAIGLWLKATVIQVPSGTWAPAGNMAEARSGAASVLLEDGTILVTGGEGASVTLASAEFFSAGSFAAAPAMNVARSGHAAVVLKDGRVLVTGGKTTGGGVTNAAEVYSPALNSWVVIASMADARSGHTATLLKDGRVLLVGGESSAGTVSTLEVFDTATGAFTFAGTMSSARKDHAAALVGDKQVLIAGGSDGANALASTETYDPEAGVVTAGPILSTPRIGLSATTLMDGRALIAGGNNGTADLSTAEMYNPETGSLSVLGSSMAAARRDHSAFLLPNNNHVLIVGGTSGGVAVSTAELFRPWDGLFHPTGAMSSVHPGSSGSPLGLDGLLLVTGGNGLASSELYGFATVKTDKDDYAPGELVTMTGSGWQPGETVSLLLHEINNPDPHDDLTLTAVADGSGRILNNQFAPDEHDLGIRFYLTASGSNSQAQTTFTDSQAWTLAISPTSVQTASTNTFTLTASDTSTNNEQIGCVRVTVPSQFTSLGSAAIVSPVGWTASLSGQILQAVANSNSLRINPNQNVMFSVQGTAPSSTTGSPFAWTGTAFSNINCSSQQFPAPTSQPTVAVTPALSVTFDTTAIADVAAATTVLSVTIGANPATLLTRGDLPKTFTDITSGTNVSYSYNSPLAVSANKQYRWLSTAGTGSASSQTSQSGSFSLTSSSSITAIYGAQFKVTFAQSGIGGDSTGTVVTINGTVTKTAAQLPFSDFFDGTLAYVYSSPVSAGSDKQYVLTTPAATPASGFTVATAVTITGTYKTQFKITFAQSGIGGDSTGTIVTINGTVSKTAAQLPFSDFFDGPLGYVYSSPVSAGSDKQYVLTTPAATPASGFTIASGVTVTGTYKAQFKITFAQSGIGGDSTGTVVTINGTVTKTAAQLPFSDFFDGTLAYVYSSPVSAGSDKQYVLTTPAATPASGFTVATAVTITGTYKTQFKITFAQSGIGGDSTGTVVTINGSVIKTAAELPFSDFFDGTLAYVFTSPLATPDPNKQYVLTAPAATPASGFTVAGAVTITGTYKAQFKITFAQSGIGGDSTGTVVTINGTVTKTAAQLPFSDFFDGTLAYVYSSPVSAGSDKQYVLTTPAATPASGFTVAGAVTITGTYKTQFKVTFAQSGIGGDSTGTVVTINGSVIKTAAELPFGDFFDGPLGYVYSSPVSAGSDKQYVLTTPAATPASGFTVAGAVTITGTYKIQYRLTLAITTGVPSGLANISGGVNGTFYDTGTMLTLSTTAMVPDLVNNRQWGFDDWSGDVTSPPSVSNPVTVTMSQPRSITANYAFPTANFANNGPVGEGSAVTVSFSSQAWIPSNPPLVPATVTAGFHYAYSCTNENLSSASFSSTAGSLANSPCVFVENGSYVVKGRIIDRNNGFSEYTTSVGVINVSPAVTITGPTPNAAVFPVGYAVPFTGIFSDPGTVDTHTAQWKFDTITIGGTVIEANGSGSVSNTYSFTTPGVYQITLTVTDDDGGVGTANTVGGPNGMTAQVVIYDPNGGFVTGGGWIDSPAGAYISNPSLTGKANFGFVSKYLKGATKPTGETEFQFKAGDFNFHSSSYDWLVVSGAKGQYKGVGEINGLAAPPSVAGATNYKFMLTATDGQLSGGGGYDKFRIKIWYEVGAITTVVYDNQAGATDDFEAAPAQPLGGGSIVIHK